MDAIKFCAKCGHELLEGANYCPFCGASVLDISDPVSRGAKYEHYEESDKSIEEKANWEGNIHAGSLSNTDSYPKEASSLTTCFKCGATIPKDSKFCPVCQVQLFVDCPKCGHRYSAQYRNCNECGTNRIQYLQILEEQETQKRKQAEALKQQEKERERKKAYEKELERKLIESVRIIKFTHVKIKEYDGTDTIGLIWNTVGATSCTIEWSNCYVDGGKFHMIDSFYYQNPRIQARAWADMCSNSIFHVDQYITFRLIAYKGTLQCCQETTNVHVHYGLLSSYIY